MNGFFVYQLIRWSKFFFKCGIQIAHEESVATNSREEFLMLLQTGGNIFLNINVFFSLVTDLWMAAFGGRNPLQDFTFMGSYKMIHTAEEDIL